MNLLCHAPFLKFKCLVVQQVYSCTVSSQQHHSTYFIVLTLVFSNLIASTDLLTIEPHTPTATPQKYEKKGGAWYNQDGMETLYTPQGRRTVYHNHTSSSVSARSSEIIQNLAHSILSHDKTTKSGFQN